MKKTKKNLKKTDKKSNFLAIIIPVAALAVSLITLLILAISLGWFGVKDGVIKEGFSEKQSEVLWEASYTRLDGRLEKEFSADSEKTLVIDFETVSGEMDILIYEKDSGYALDIDGMQTYYQCVGNGSYEIPFSEDIVVRLDAREHSGRYSVSVR